MSMVYYHWDLGRPRLSLLEPRSVGCGGGAPGYWQYDRQRESAAGVVALVPRERTSSSDVADNKNRTVI